MRELMPHPWKLDLRIVEHDDDCEVTAHLDTGDRTMSGVGRSRRNPADPQVPRIGEELAVARALQDLAHRLGDDAWSMIEGFGAPSVERSTAERGW